MSERKACTPESLFDMRWVSDPQIAPDGQQVAYVEHWIEEIDKDGKQRKAYRSAIFLSAAPDARPRRLTYAHTGKDYAPRWSPDGQQLAFLSTRDGDAPQIFALYLAGGEAEQITKTENLSEGVEDYDWHPSGTMFCFTSTGHKTEDEKKQQEIHDEKVYEGRMPFKFDGVGLLEERRSQIYRIHRDGSECTQITTLERDAGRPMWSPDGRRIAFTSQGTDVPEYKWVDNLYVVDVDGSDLRQITRSVGPVSEPVWSPDGTRIAYLGHDRRRGNATTMKVLVANLEDCSTCCISEALTGEVGELASGDSHIGSPSYRTTRPYWDRQERVTFEALVHGRAGLYRVAASGGEIESISTSGLSVVAFTQRGDTIAFIGETNARSGEVYTMREGHRLQRRSHAGDHFFSTYRIQPPEHVQFKGADGWDLEGWVIRPLDMEQASEQRHPLIVYVHGGPHTAYGNGFFHEFQVLAAAGFGIFFTNPRGSSSYGEEFADAVRHHFGEKDYEDVMHAADLAASWEWVDEQRMGIMGGSYGGFMTNWIITHTDRFAAACSQRSISNLYSFAGTSDVGPEFSLDEYGDLPWRDEELLMSKSPIRYVQNVKTPTLILHQEQDHRCPIEQAEQLYSALVVLGVPVKLVRFPDEGHELPRAGQPQRRVNRMGHIVDWFTRYLKPARAQV
ncbi:MAG TPA: S9 family peptidase [Herpetosiphonaceae bacterium]